MDIITAEQQLKSGVILTHKIFEEEGIEKYIYFNPVTNKICDARHLAINPKYFFDPAFFSYIYYDNDDWKVYEMSEMDIKIHNMEVFFSIKHPNLLNSKEIISDYIRNNFK